MLIRDIKLLACMGKVDESSDTDPSRLLIQLLIIIGFAATTAVAHYALA